MTSIALHHVAQMGSLLVSLLFVLGLCSCGERPAEPEQTEPVAPELTFEEPALSTVSQARPGPGRETHQNLGGGFLWKPVSHSDGKLVVLIPSKLTGKTATASSTLFTDVHCRFMHPRGDGRYTGIHNGDREHFRFPDPGKAYGPVWFGVLLKDGSQAVWEIREPSRRLER